MQHHIHGDGGLEAGVGGFEAEADVNNVALTSCARYCSFGYREKGMFD